VTRLLEIESVTAGYGETTVLREVSCSVPAGAIVALIGANGAGKSTLLRVASGVLAPQSGRVLLHGRDVTGSSPDRLAALGVCSIPDGRAVFPSLTVRENLRLFAGRGEEAAGLERAAEAFPRLGARLSQVVGTMSGGEQQMVALARAYLQNPSVILVDEPSMGLAPIVVDEIFAFLAQMATRGCSLLIVEQFVTKVLAVAQYVYILQRGSVAFAGEPVELARRDLLDRYLGDGAVSGPPPSG
jgi:branched-chain amino acid transport system ATP-binding protein